MSVECVIYDRGKWVKIGQSVWGDEVIYDIRKDNKLTNERNGDINGEWKRKAIGLG